MSEKFVLDPPSSLSCPECGGTVTKIEGGPIAKYACHIGHVLTGEAMLEAQSERIEDTLGSALAMLNERRELCRQMLGDGIPEAEMLQAILGKATANAERVRDLLNERGSRPISM